MAIAFDAGADSGILGSSPGTYSHTCTGSDRLLLVAVFGDFSSDNVTGVTYNSVACTLLGKVQVVRWHYLFGLIAPATGSNTVSITFSGGIAGAASASYTGVVSTAISSPDATGTNSASGATSLTQTLTTTANNCWMAMNGGANNQAVSAGTGAHAAQFWTFNNNMCLFDSNGPLSPGSNSMQFTVGSATDLTTVGFSFAPVGGSSPSLFRPSLLAGLGSGGSFFQNPLG